VFPLVPGIAVVGPDFLGAAALGEQLQLSLPVMSEFGAPIYPLIFGPSHLSGAA
jgi:hypothetical protein